jgi:hypothetical protein
MHCSGIAPHRAGNDLTDATFTGATKPPGSPSLITGYSQRVVQSMRSRSGA